MATRAVQADSECQRCAEQRSEVLAARQQAGYWRWQWGAMRERLRKMLAERDAARRALRAERKANRELRREGEQTATRLARTEAQLARTEAQLEEALAAVEVTRQQKEHEEGKNRLPTRHRFGRRTEQQDPPGAGSEGAADERPKPRRPRGQQPGTRGHGRTPRADLPVSVDGEPREPAERCCPECGLEYESHGTVASDVIEVDVKA